MPLGPVSTRGFLRALQLFVWTEVGARIRGDLEIDIHVYMPNPEDFQRLVQSYAETFRSEQAQSMFAGDGAGNWKGSGRVRHNGNVAAVRSRLESWARTMLPDSATFRIRRIARRAAG
jgi:hypothetical protein